MTIINVYLLRYYLNKTDMLTNHKKPAALAGNQGAASP